MSTETLIAVIRSERPHLTRVWREAWLRQLRAIQALPEIQHDQA